MAYAYIMGVMQLLKGQDKLTGPDSGAGTLRGQTVERYSVILLAQKI